MNENDTYLVTLQFDPPTFEWLQSLRTEYFPPSLNQVPAHLTLLHKVSEDQVSRLRACWTQLDRLGALPIRFTGIKQLGRGTAIVVEAPLLADLRGQVMRCMQGDFSSQDRQPFKAHVTIQNKVSPASARELYERLSATFVERKGEGLGLLIWRYLGGPWSLSATLAFQ